MSHGQVKWMIKQTVLILVYQIMGLKARVTGGVRIGR
jgi:hypothetical protein